MGELIQFETHKWLVMREAPMNPKAVIERVTDSHGDARFLVFAWDYEPTKRRMMGLYPNIQEAVISVPWPKRSEKVDHNGYPPGTTQRMRADRRRAARRGDGEEGRGVRIRSGNEFGEQRPRFETRAAMEMRQALEAQYAKRSFERRTALRRSSHITAGIAPTQCGTTPLTRWGPI